MERLHADLFLFSYQDFFIFTCPFKKKKKHGSPAHKTLKVQLNAV